MSPNIDIQGITKRFHSTLALDGVSIQVGRGVTGLLGPNGAGKTTLLRIVATALAPDRGSVRVLGHDPGAPDGRLEIRRRLGYLPQDPGFYTGFTAFDFVDYVAILKEITNRDQRHEEVARVLDKVGLSDRMHQRIRSLSGGMRRRVGLAQALLGRPEILVLDEPSVGLDPVQRMRFREVVSQIARDHTVLLSTHLTEDVAALCARVVVIDNGSVLFHGDSSELAAVADQKVWRSREPDPTARLSWVTGDGRYRHIGEPPATAQLVPPTLEDGYLLLAGTPTREEVRPCTPTTSS
jgi:ABC-2 type transport system ATP-binding protein